MKVKKLNLEVEENNFDKKLLCDIVKEISNNNRFMFNIFGWGNGYKHTDYTEMITGYKTKLDKYGNTSSNNSYHESIHIDHSEYSDSSAENSYKEYAEYSEYKL